MFVLQKIYRPGGYTKDPLMSTQHMDLRWSMILYTIAISIGMPLPSEPGKWRSEAFADACLIGKKTAYACQMIVTSFMRHLRKIRCSKLFDGAIICHGVLLAVSGVISFDHVHPSVWQRCLQTFLLYSLDRFAQPGGSSYVTSRLFWHINSFCSLCSSIIWVHVPCNMCKPRKTNATLEQAQAKPTKRPMISCGLISQTWQILETTFLIDGLRLWITYCTL